MGTLRVIIRPEAYQDLIEAREFLSKERPSAAVRFADAVPAALDLLARFPGIGSLKDYGHPRLDRVRSWLVPGFKKYLILYTASANELTVWAVTHGSRDIPRLLRDRA